MASISKDSIVITIETLEESTKVECPICYDELNTNNTIKLNSCSHSLCETCENTLRKTSDILRCPLCRTIVEKPPKKKSVWEWIRMILATIILTILLVFYVGFICSCVWGILFGGIPRIIAILMLIAHFFIAIIPN